MINVSRLKADFQRGVVDVDLVVGDFRNTDHLHSEISSVYPHPKLVQNSGQRQQRLLATRVKVDRFD